MTIERKVSIVKDFFRNNPNCPLLTESNSIGYGLWSISVYGWSDENTYEFLFELIGSNGTRSEKDDLWADMDEIFMLAAL